MPARTTRTAEPPNDEPAALEERIRILIESQTGRLETLETAIDERSEALAQDIDQCQAELENELAARSQQITELTTQASEAQNELQALAIDYTNLSKSHRETLSILQALQAQLQTLTQRATETPPNSTEGNPIEPESREATRERNADHERPKRRFL